MRGQCLATIGRANCTQSGNLSTIGTRSNASSQPALLAINMCAVGFIEISLFKLAADGFFPTPKTQRKYWSGDGGKLLRAL